MKKLLLTVLVAVSTGTLVALPIGNPAEPGLLTDGIVWEGVCADYCDPCVSWCDAFSVRVGFYGDYVFNRHMRVHDHHRCSRDVIEDTELFTNAGYLALNLCDRFDVFTNLGATNLYMHTNTQPFGGISGERFELETDTRFSWGIGARAILFQCGCATFGIEGQYFSTRPHVKRITVGCDSSIYPKHSFDSHYYEYQVGIGIAYRIWNLVPYVGAKWSRAHWKFDHHRLTTGLIGASDIHLLDTRSQFHGGYAVGVTLVDCEKASVTVEARFPDEKALYVNGQVRF